MIIDKALLLRRNLSTVKFQLSIISEVVSETKHPSVFQSLSGCFERSCQNFLNFFAVS